MALSPSTHASDHMPMIQNKFTIAIHGGAGVISASDPEALTSAKEALRRCLAAGQTVLQLGGSALDAVEAAVVALEDEPCFNAGRGSVYTRSGRHELEASVMTSAKRCGAATLLTTVRHPVRLARLVMERTPHSFLGGPAAEAFAEAHGLEMVPNSFFDTALRTDQWRRCQAAGAAVAARGGAGAAAGAGGGRPAGPDVLMQTVGAVAVDAAGRLAAATSTGGRTDKWDGRIGDTPLNGAGNYACPACAVSGTGMGEEFIRHCVAHDVAARMQYKNVSLSQAVAEVVDQVLQPDDGGVIAVDCDYNVVLRFNSVGMYRGWADSSGAFEVAVLRGEGAGEGSGPLLTGKSSEPPVTYSSHLLH